MMTQDNKATSEKNMENEMPEQGSAVQENEINAEDAADNVVNMAGENVDSAEADEKQNDELAALKEMLQRERAEFANYKKRTASESARSSQFAVINFLTDFIPVYDNLDMVANQQGGDMESFLKGVQLIQKQFNDALDKHRILTVDPLNQPFDPQTMEAIQMEENPEQEGDLVSMVFQKGFATKFGDNVHTIRTSKVKVTKGGAAKAAEEKTESESENEPEEGFSAEA